MSSARCEDSRQKTAHIYFVDGLFSLIYFKEEEGVGVFEAYFKIPYLSHNIPFPTDIRFLKEGVI